MGGNEIHKTYAKRFVQTHVHMQFFFSRNARGKRRGTDDSGGIHSRIKGLFAYLRERGHHVVHAGAATAAAAICLNLLSRARVLSIAHKSHFHGMMRERHVMATTTHTKIRKILCNTHT